jgi:hypothetical protein
MGTHCAGILYDVRNVFWGVNCVGAVRALLRYVAESGHDEREALAIDDVPVKSIDLRSGLRQCLTRSPTDSRGARRKDRRTWTHDIASSVRSMSETGKLHATTQISFHIFQAQNEEPIQKKRSTYKFRAVSSMKPRYGYVPSQRAYNNTTGMTKHACMQRT